ncbi:MAG TPA: class I SAM-dependent methyltransferase [Thermoanaerobaculia bacterium]|nr:class I SAM-dependent methyltransferase [Thermoanaerobaculia bacterium]
MAGPPDNSTGTNSSISSPPTGEGVVIDIGTGDGLYVYQAASRNPRKFYIGVDASPRPLEKVSEKIHRKPAKGGLPNALFVQAAVEDLPAELDGVADEVHVHFPWGSLLRAVATGDRLVLENLRRICSPGALLEVIFGLDPERDQTEIARLGLEPLSVAYIDSTLTPTYREAGFDVTERGVLPEEDWLRLQTSWAKRLRGGAGRSVFFIVARAIEP